VLSGSWRLCVERSSGKLSTRFNAKPAKNRQARKAISFVPKRDHRIDLDRSACRHQTGSQSHSCEQQRNGHKGERVGCAGREEQVCHQSRQRKCASQTDANSDQRKRHPMTNDQPEHQARLSPGREPVRDLFRTDGLSGLQWHIDLSALRRGERGASDQCRKTIRRQIRCEALAFGNIEQRSFSAEIQSRTTRLRAAPGSRGARPISGCAARRQRSWTGSPARPPPACPGPPRPRSRPWGS